MRALLGGAIGAVVAAAAWLAVDHFSQANLGWLVVFVGLVTGVCVHRAGGGRGSFAGGALAIILTLAAIAGGQQVYAKIMQANSTTVSTVAIASPKIAADDAEEDSAGEGDAPREVDELELSAEGVGAGDRGYSKSAIKKNFSQWDMVWMCLAALAAYVTGKGGDPPTSPTATEPQEPGESPSEVAEEAAAKQADPSQDEQV